MNSSFSFSSPSKVILTGEHSVVYGHPALVSAVSLHSSATASYSPDKFYVQSPSLDLSFQREEIKNYLIRASNAREKYLLGDKDELMSLQATPGIVAIVVLGMFLDDLSSPVRINIDSEIPLSRGLGSSSSVASSIFGSITKLLDREIEEDELFRVVNFSENVMHGSASGVDAFSIVRGGTTVFKREGEKPSFESVGSLPLSDLILIDSGESKESTGEMVSYVRGGYEEKKGIIAKIGDLTSQVISMFKKARVDWSFLSLNERFLEDLGVVSQAGKKVVSLVRSFGGHAKVCGAGGREAGSGIVLAYCERRDELLSELRRKSIDYYLVEIGGVGCLT